MYTLKTNKDSEDGKWKAFKIPSTKITRLSRDQFAEFDDYLWNTLQRNSWLGIGETKDIFPREKSARVKSIGSKV